MPHSRAPSAAWTAFDPLASDYDQVFTHSVVGQAQRAAVWARFDAVFDRGSHVLELGCGTGEDALYLARRGCRVLATDRSSTMVDAARDKWHAATRSESGPAITGHVEHAVLDARRLSDPETLISEDGAEGGETERFDGVLANFGVLNCLGDHQALATLSTTLATRVRPGGMAVLCVMGPVVPWEWLWFLAHGQPRVALRRLRRGGVDWNGLRVRYPRPRMLRRAFTPAWTVRRTAAVGALIPPSYAEPWAKRYPNTVERLARIERRFETIPPLAHLADHYLIELERGS